MPTPLPSLEFSERDFDGDHEIELTDDFRWLDAPDKKGALRIRCDDHGHNYQLYIHWYGLFEEGGDEIIHSGTLATCVAAENKIFDTNDRVIS
jgi:hypothetical protein